MDELYRGTSLSDNLTLFDRKDFLTWENMPSEEGRSGYQGSDPLFFEWSTEQYSRSDGTKSLCWAYYSCQGILVHFGVIISARIWPYSEVKAQLFTLFKQKLTNSNEFQFNFHSHGIRSLVVFHLDHGVLLHRKPRSLSHNWKNGLSHYQCEWLSKAAHYQVWMVSKRIDRHLF